MRRAGPSEFSASRRDLLGQPRSGARNRDRQDSAGIIISNDLGNQYAARVIVAPVTSRGVYKIYPFEVLFQAQAGGLRETSKILMDQIRTVDKHR